MFWEFEDGLTNTITSATEPAIRSYAGLNQITLCDRNWSSPEGKYRPICTLVPVCGDFIRAAPNSQICTPQGRPGSWHAEPSRELLGAAKQHRARPGG